jgi:hypothetical protein
VVVEPIARSQLPHPRDPLDEHVGPGAGLELESRRAPVRDVTVAVEPMGVKRRQRGANLADRVDALPARPVAPLEREGFTEGCGKEVRNRAVGLAREHRRHDHVAVFVDVVDRGPLAGDPRAVAVNGHLQENGVGLAKRDADGPVAVVPRRPRLSDGFDRSVGKDVLERRVDAIVSAFVHTDFLEAADVCSRWGGSSSATIGGTRKREFRRTRQVALLESEKPYRELGARFCRSD